MMTRNYTLRDCIVKTWLKILLSSIVSFLIFALGCLAIVRYNGFELVELRFYEPRVIQSVETHLQSISNAFDEFYADTLFSLSNFAAQESTASYFEKTASSSAVKARTDSLGLLRESIPGLEVRLVESDGKHIHFSTFASDILKREGSITAYKPYEDASDIAYDDLSASNSAKLHFVSKAGMLVFSIPLKHEGLSLSGTLMCFVPVEDFSQYLVSKGIITINQYGVLVAPDALADGRNSGIVFGFPSVGQSLVAQQIVEAWSGSKENVTQIVVKESDGEKLTLITQNSSSYVLTGWVCNESDFVFSRYERMLLLVCLFIVLYLFVFFLFNLKHESEAVIKKRLQKFGNEVLRKYQKRAWPEVSRELEGRRQNSYDEIKKSLGKIALKNEDKLRFYFDRCWSEILLTLSGGSVQTSQSLTPTVTPLASKPAVPAKATQPEAVDELEDAEPLEEAEAVDELEDVEPLEEAEAVDELEDAEPVEEAEAVDELEDAEPLEEAEAVDELEAAEPVEEAETVDELEDAEPVEELEDAEPVEEAEAVDELEDAEPLEEAEAVDELEDAEPVEEAEAVDQLEDAEPLKEATAIDTSDMFEEDDGLPPAALLKDLHAEESLLPATVQLQKEESPFEEKLEFEEVKPRRTFEYSNNSQGAISFSVQNIDFSHLDEDTSSSDDTVAAPYQKKADDMVARLQHELVHHTSVSHSGLLGRAIELKKELEEPQQAIVEQEDGVYVIPKNLHTDSVKQNADFKSLVDSVLKND